MIEKSKNTVFNHNSGDDGGGNNINDNNNNGDSYNFIKSITILSWSPNQQQNYLNHILN